MKTNNNNKKNIEFRITFCETNLRFLADEPESEERTIKMQKMMDEIKRLKTEIMHD